MRVDNRKRRRGGSASPHPRPVIKIAKSTHLTITTALSLFIDAQLALVVDTGQPLPDIFTRRCTPTHPVHIPHFVSQLYDVSGDSDYSLFMAFLYYQRLRRYYDVVSSTDWQILWISLVRIASKYVEDAVYSGRHYRRVFPWLATSICNQTEHFCLTCLQYRLNERPGEVDAGLCVLPITVRFPKTILSTHEEKGMDSSIDMTPPVTTVNSHKARSTELRALLHSAGIASIPRDSILCSDYIQLGENARVTDVQEIVKKMCECKYLHEYCNFDLGYHMAKGVITYRGAAIPRDQWRELVNKCVLLTTGLTRFPPQWPWLNNITPNAWKKDHDRTSSLLDPAIHLSYNNSTQSRHQTTTPTRET